MDHKLKDLAEYLRTVLPETIGDGEIRHGELALRVPRDALIRVLQFLRDDAKCRFTMLCDICGVDYPDRQLRFDVVYNLLSLNLNQRIRLKVEADDIVPVPSATGLFSSAGWWEREVW